MSPEEINRHLIFSSRFGDQYQRDKKPPTQEEAQAILDKFQASFDQVFKYPGATASQLREVVEPYAVHVDPRKQEPA